MKKEKLHTAWSIVRKTVRAVSGSIEIDLSYSLACFSAFSQYFNSGLYSQRLIVSIPAIDAESVKDDHPGVTAKLFQLIQTVDDAVSSTTS